MIHRVASILFASMLLVAVSGVKADSGKEEAAISAALKWLTKIDEGKYAGSWDEAAKYFQNTVKKEQWERSLSAVRKSLGLILSRVPINTTYKTALPGVPDGQYVVIQFRTSFENQKSAIEIVTPMLDEDGNWRVSGYYIK